MAKMEVKETMDRARFAQLLRQCADAIEGDRDFTLTLHGQQITTHPQGKMEVEYEIEKDGEHELEFEIKWREAA